MICGVEARIVVPLLSSDVERMRSQRLCASRYRLNPFCSEGFECVEVRSSVVDDGDSSDSLGLSVDLDREL